MNNRLVLLLAAFFLLRMNAQAADAPAVETLQIDGKTVTPARYAKAFIGPGNVRVDVGPYSGVKGDGAILVFHGIESEWDGKAINHRMEEAAYHGIRYVTQRGTHPWVTLVSRKDNRGEERWDLYVPGVKDSIQLVPSDGASQALSPKAILQDYQRQPK